MVGLTVERITVKPKCATIPIFFHLHSKTSKHLSIAAAFINPSSLLRTNLRFPLIQGTEMFSLSIFMLPFVFFTKKINRGSSAYVNIAVKKIHFFGDDWLMNDDTLNIYIYGVYIYIHIHTHTHTHIYIHLYILTSSVSLVSPSLGRALHTQHIALACLLSIPS